MWQDIIECLVHNIILCYNCPVCACMYINMYVCMYMHVSTCIFVQYLYPGRKYVRMYIDKTIIMKMNCMFIRVKFLLCRHTYTNTYIYTHA